MLHRYTLEKYKGPGSRFTCPGCSKAKVFTRYIDSQTGEHIAPSVGRCSREIKCGYHYKPKQYFQDHGNDRPKDERPIAFRQVQPLQLKRVSFIANDVFKSSLKGYNQNNFILYLQRLFGADITLQLIERYFIGTSDHWSGATAFWQIDAKGRIRTGKIMLYNPITGKRVKEPFNHITWVHKARKLPEFELQQCLFGEHLLRSDPQKPVAIVESEKTAIVASVYRPGFVWLAVGSLSNLTAERCKPLSGRKVILYPDLKAFDKWKAKAAELSHLAKFAVSDLLERKASEAERREGLDIADYLIRFDYRHFVKPDPIAAEPVPLFHHLYAREAIPPVPAKRLPEQPEPDTWGQDIANLESYFASIRLPAGPVRLNQCGTISNLPLFIESHFATVKANNGKRTFLPYLTRLQELRQTLTLRGKSSP